jgi:hypothetical protein
MGIEYRNVGPMWRLPAEAGGVPFASDAGAHIDLDLQRSS